MIIVDMPMPENCKECPMGYTILTGNLEGHRMCRALEWKDRADGRIRDRSELLVDGDAEERDRKCPIRMGVTR